MPKIKVAANQRIAKIMPKREVGKNNPYFIMPIGDFQSAVKDLNTRGGIVVWTYLASWQEGDEVGLSPKFFEQEYGLSRSCYNDAIRLLEDKGYLVREDDGAYQFFMTPSWSAKEELKTLGL